MTADRVVMLLQDEDGWLEDDLEHDVEAGMDDFYDADELGFWSAPIMPWTQQRFRLSVRPPSSFAVRRITWELLVNGVVMILSAHTLCMATRTSHTDEDCSQERLAHLHAYGHGATYVL